MMSLNGNAKIVLIGVEDEFIDVIVAFLQEAFDFITLEPGATLNTLDNTSNIALFIINTDSTKFNIKVIAKALSINPRYQGIPKLGLAHRKHIDNMEGDIRFCFDDLVLMPCGCEDLLNRIDVWIKTFEMIRNNQIISVDASCGTPSPFTF